MAQRQIPWYANGSCPLDRLTVIATGTNSSDGTWFHRLPRATLRRWRSLRQRAFNRTGRWLYISDGWATDRPLWVQVMSKEKYGIYAATPGMSSHGMVFIGLQTAAIDAGNWSWVYADHGYGGWLEDLRAEGFDRLPDGYQQEGEYHHIIDYNPWDDEPEFGGSPAGYDASQFEEDDMSAAAEAQIQAIHDALFNGNPITGFENRTIDALLTRVVDTNNKLSIPDAGYGRPEVLQQGVDKIIGKLETGAGYDWLPAISNQLWAVSPAVGTGASVDVDALAAAILEGVGAEVAATLGRLLLKTAQ